MTSVSIEKVDASQIALLQSIAIRTFNEAFAEQNTDDNIEQYISDTFNVEQIRCELFNTDSAFYFTKNGEDMIGYLKLNFGDAQTELKHQDAIEIERIYILNQFCGMGIGTILLEKSILIAEGRKAKYIWLGVWEENPRAIRFYQKNGFSEFGKHTFVLGDDEQTDIMMKLEL